MRALLTFDAAGRCEWFIKNRSEERTYQNK